MSERLRVAVVGAGFWSGYQTAAWLELPHVEVVAVCDYDAAKATALAKRFNISQVFLDPMTMLDAIRPDLLDIITDPSSHAALVHQAIDRKIPVVCQKPMALTLSECEALVSLNQEQNGFFAVHENWRWQAPIRRVKRILACGTIGEVFRARWDFITAFDVFSNQPKLKQEKRFILADLGVHIFDAARCLFGEFDSVSCQSRRIHNDIEGEDVATVLMQSQATTISINIAYAGTPIEDDLFPHTRLFVEGTQGSLSIDVGYKVRITTRAGTTIETVKPKLYSWVNPDYALVQSSIVDCHRDISLALIEGRRAETDAADNLRTMRAVEAAYESAATGMVVKC